MKRAACIGVLAAAVVAAALLAMGSGGSAGGTYLVRAVFDDASFAVAGEDVRVAGANVGTIRALAVAPGYKAAVTLAITNRAFAPFHANATCAIRPQSLIGEQYVDCNPGSASAPPLERIGSGPGAGAHYLSVTRTSSPIDTDIVQNISTQPVRQSLAMIIDEFGTGLAARGSDLNAVIRRANPALANTDRVLQILAGQNRTLARLATDSDTVLAPLARERSHIAGFIRQANTTAVASAARARDISNTFRLLPSYLQQLRPLMADLGQLADQGTPLMQSLGQSASSLGQEFGNLTPFATRARTALIDLGAAAQKAQPALQATQPLAQRLGRLGTAGQPAAANLKRLLDSLNSSGAIQQLMKLLFNGAVAGNGFDSLGHYVREEPLVSSCTNYATSPVPGCSANFGGGSSSDSRRAPAAGSAHAKQPSRRGASPAGNAHAKPPSRRGGSPAAGGPDSVVAQAVKSASAGDRTASTIGGLLTFLSGGGR